MVLCHVRKKKKEYNEDDDVEKSRSQNQPAPVLKNKNKMNYKEFRLTVLIHTYNRQMILNLRMHIISHESVFLCICACAHAVKSCLFLDFFSPAVCGRWSQAQSDTAIKQHLVEMGWSTSTSVAIGIECVYECVDTCVCLTASRSVGTPQPVWVMVPAWIIGEMCQKKRENTSARRCKNLKKKVGVEIWITWFLFLGIVCM